MSAARLLLWRHGRTAANASGRFQGQLDVPLDAVGQVQIKEAAELLARVIGTASCRIVSSDLSRAHDTALALGTRLGLSVTTDPALREISLGRWQGLNHDDVIAVEPEEFAAWRAGEDIRPGGGETRTEAAIRVERAILAHAEATPDDVLVIASHGGVIRGAIQRLIGIERWSPRLLAPIPNVHWSRLDRRPGGWILSAYNVGPLDGTVFPER
ncbi:MAG: glucosyl-3-phosphoglycerate phosphatase [Actinomycetota bacterium]|nr:glucosyl-3-phosphoglycerate phosphatase [Actinomycetota bacterium]